MKIVAIVILALVALFSGGCSVLFTSAVFGYYFEPAIFLLWASGLLICGVCIRYIVKLWQAIKREAAAKADQSGNPPPGS
ncbi:MAG: hypothetical protein WBA91_04235 [Paracoccaceae bacterium]